MPVRGTGWFYKQHQTKYNMINFRKGVITLGILMLAVQALQAQVQLPKVISSNMVLQRDKPVQIWGWAGKSSTVSVAFNGQQVQAKADSKGRWKATLKPHGLRRSL